MSISQRSYEVRIAKYRDGDALIQGWLDYVAANPLITKAANTAFIADVESDNEDVITTEQALNDLRKQRIPLTFRLKVGSDINCLENRMKNILQYVMGELPEKKAAINKLKQLIRKIKPQYPKKQNPPLPRGSGKSPSERSFNALVGYGKEAIGVITALGAAYAPTNVNISLAQFTAFVGSVDGLNIDIAKAEELYGNAVRIRADIYDETNGMTDRISMIKSYLAGFEGGKQSPHYIEFSQAVK